MNKTHIMGILPCGCEGISWLFGKKITKRECEYHRTFEDMKLKKYVYNVR
jgi:hypothetical protein